MSQEPDRGDAAPGTSRRFNALMYTFLTVFVVLLTACYIYAEPVLEWTEELVRTVFM